MPLGAAHFPLLPAHARRLVAGGTCKPRPGSPSQPREPGLVTTRGRGHGRGAGSPADKAGRETRRPRREGERPAERDRGRSHGPEEKVNAAVRTSRGHEGDRCTEPARPGGAVESIDGRCRTTSPAGGDMERGVFGVETVPPPTGWKSWPRLAARPGRLTIAVERDGRGAPTG